MKKHGLKTDNKAVLAIGFVVLWIIVSVLFYYLWVIGAIYTDFYPLWSGARQLLFQEQELYSIATTKLIQIELFGKTLPPGSDQQGFAYPATLVVYLLPLWFFNNVGFSTAIWIGFSFSLTLLTLVVLRRRHGPPPWIIISYLFWYFPLLMLIFGQFTIMALASVGISYWAYHHHQDLLAGSIAAIGLVKPELMLLPLAVILFIAIRSRRYKILFAFFITNLIVFLVSFWIAGFWIPQWLAAINRYKDYARVSWTLELLWNYSPGLAVIFCVLIAYMFYTLRQESLFLISASVPAGMMLLPQTFIWGLTMMLIPFTLLWFGKNRYIIMGILVLGWISMVGTLEIDDFWKIQNLLIPTITLAMVIFAYYEKTTQSRINRDGFPR